jgi:ferredoxin
MTVFYFTATGNSLAVAKRICSNVEGKLVSIPQIVNSDNLHYKDDAIGIVFPIYGFSAPKIVRRFLDKAKLEADYTFAIGTYGNLPGATMPNVQKLAQNNGYRFDYTNTLLMVDNYLPMFEMEDQAEKLPAKKTDENLAKIVDDIAGRRHAQAGASLALKAFTALLNTVHSFDSISKKYTVNNDCNKCGTCAKVCPVKNITITDKVCFGDNCQACFACLHNCPKNALHIKGERSEKRWRNPEVSLKEIIDANNRS